jgi:hypothetical protein
MRFFAIFGVIIGFVNGAWASDSNLYESFIGIWKTEKCQMTGRISEETETIPHDSLRIELVEKDGKSELEVYYLNDAGVETKNVVSYTDQYKKVNPAYENAEMENLQIGRVMGSTLVVGTINNWSEQDRMGLYFTTLALNKDGTLNYERKGMTSYLKGNNPSTTGIWHLRCTFNRHRKSER